MFVTVFEFIFVSHFGPIIFNLCYLSSFHWLCIQPESANDLLALGLNALKTGSS